MNEKIKLPSGGINQIARLMGLSRKTVSLACAGRKDNPLARRIRHCALHHGGVFARTDIPRGQWLTDYNHVAGQMTATFWNGYTARVSLNGKPMQIEDPDGLVETLPDPKASELFGIFSAIAQKNNY